MSDVSRHPSCRVLVLAHVICHDMYRAATVRVGSGGRVSCYMPMPAIHISEAWITESTFTFNNNELVYILTKSIYEQLLGYWVHTLHDDKTCTPNEGGLQLET